MKLIDLKMDNWYTFLIEINWALIVILVLAGWLISKFVKKYIKRIQKHSLIVNEIELGIGSSNIKFSYDKKDQEIAYKLWIELSTRKIGIPFDNENDVIKEVYDSWYEFFKTARELLKELPVNKISCSSDLIELTEKVLNVGLRPHLTKWQAKFRRWYEKEMSKESVKTPQEIQREYPEYSSLINDLISTNEKMIEYKELMKKIAFERE